MQTFIQLRFLFLIAMAATCWNSVDARVLKSKKMSKKAATGKANARSRMRTLVIRTNLWRIPCLPMSTISPTKTSRTWTSFTPPALQRSAHLMWFGTLTQVPVGGKRKRQALVGRFLFNSRVRISPMESLGSCTDGMKVEAACRYHGVVREDGGIYQDIFGVIRVTYNKYDMIDNVFVQRFHTINRPY